MSPEFNKAETSNVETLESAKAIEASLLENYIGTTLSSPESICEIPATKSNELGDVMNIAINKQEQVSQRLRAIIKAGNEFFSVIDASSGFEDGSIIDSTILTRHIAGGKRAEFVGFIEKGEKPTSVGRSTQEALDMTVSRNHFAIAHNHAGDIGVADLNSSNHTEVFMPDANHLGKFDGKNPVGDVNFWSIKSKQLKDILLNQNR